MSDDSTDNEDKIGDKEEVRVEEGDNGVGMAEGEMNIDGEDIGVGEVDKVKTSGEAEMMTVDEKKKAYLKVDHSKKVPGRSKRKGQEVEEGSAMFDFIKPLPPFKCRWVVLMAYFGHKKISKLICNSPSCFVLSH